jgi:broad specificity phosphatase PhoE
MTARTHLRSINRVASVVGLILAGLGAAGTLIVAILVWQIEIRLNEQGSIYGVGPGAGSAPTVVDRVVAAAQYGGALAAETLLVVAAGIALRLAAAHLPDLDPFEHQGAPPLSPITEVELQVE